MSNKKKRIVILTENELRKTLSRLTSEIIDRVKNLDNLLLVGIPTRGIDLAEVLKKEPYGKPVDIWACGKRKRTKNNENIKEIPRKKCTDTILNTNCIHHSWYSLYHILY